MKKATRILAVGLLAVTLLSGCAKTFTCGLCGKTVKERPNTWKCWARSSKSASPATTVWMSCPIPSNNSFLKYDAAP